MVVVLRKRTGYPYPRTIGRPELHELCSSENHVSRALREASEVLRARSEEEEEPPPATAAGAP